MKNKKKSEQLAAEWEALMKRHSKPLERGAVSKGVKFVKPRKEAAKQGIITPETPKSLVTPGGSTALPEKKIYTGQSMVGIAQMHKSNAVPIFNHQAAIDVASMRR